MAAVEDLGCERRSRGVSQSCRHPLTSFCNTLIAIVSPNFAISSIFNGHVIAAEDDSSGIHSQKHNHEDHLHSWDFVIPTVMFPPGWFQIQNSGTGELLNHTYACNPPILLRVPDSPQQSEYRESWQFQWTLAHSRCYDTAVGSDINSWHIINRLTHTHLSPRFGDETPETLAGHGHELDWELELDPSRNWKIRNRVTSCFLRHSGVRDGEGSSVLCDEKRFTMDGGTKSWALK